jgi:hypothetical protein
MKALALAAALLFGLASAASAECAWVLWGQEGDLPWCTVEASLR